MSRSSPPPRRIHKRLPLPPPPQRPSLALWPDLDALDDDLAWAMFLLSRRMRAMADTAPPGLGRWARGLEVRAAAAGAPEIAADLRLLVKASGVPDENRPPLAGACFRLAEWAQTRGVPELAVQFAAAAAALDPTSARRAFEAARLHRRCDRLGEAEILYGRAVWLSRSAKQWGIFVRAHLGLGALHQWRGQHEAGLAHFTSASHAAWSLSGEKWLAAITQHELLAATTEANQLEDALAHARRANEWMPKHAESVPALVHDASLMMVRLQAYGLAAPLLAIAVEKLSFAHFRAIASSTLAHALGGVGSLHQYLELRRNLLPIAASVPQHAGAIHANLAAGAHLLGLTTEAEWHAVQSLDVATSRRELGIAAEARATLDAVRRGATPARSAIHDPPTHLRTLAHDLETRLAVWRGPTWKRKRQSGAADLGEV